jgi:superfamily I DNA/RNA helicase
MLAPPPYGRLIAVGDPSQAIYGFRGADATAMTDMQREFNMTVLPLSVSYRCSQSVVKEAQKYETSL